MIKLSLDKMLKSFGLLIIASSFIAVACNRGQGDARDDKTEDSEEMQANEVDEGFGNRWKTKEKRTENNKPLMDKTQLNELLPEAFGNYSKNQNLKLSVPDSLSSEPSTGVAQAYITGEGNQFIVLIIDYKGNENYYNSLLSDLIEEVDVENENERSRRFSIQDEVIGQETFFKPQKKCRIVAGVAHRFLVVLEADNQVNEEFTKEVLLDVLPIATMLNR